MDSSRLGDAGPRAAVDLARDLALSLHAGQHDRQGNPFATVHLATVADVLAPHGVYAQASGWLYDSVRSGACEPQALRSAGVDPCVVSTVAVLASGPDEDFEAYAARVRNHMVGCLVLAAVDTVEMVADRSRSVLDVEAQSIWETQGLPRRKVLLANSRLVAHDVQRMIDRAGASLGAHSALVPG